MNTKSLFGQNALIRGSMRSCEEVMIDCQGSGDIESGEKVLFTEHANWQGNIRAAALEIQAGAQFEGAVVIEAVKKSRWLERFWR